MGEALLDARWAPRLAMMLKSGLVDFERLGAWADAQVLQLETPPTWLLELCLARRAEEALQALAESSAPPGSSDADAEIEEAVACLFLSYRRGDCTWARFLGAAGACLDAANGRWTCESVYAWLNELEQGGFSPELERTQCAEMEHTLAAALERLAPVLRAVDSSG